MTIFSIGNNNINFQEWINSRTSVTNQYKFHCPFYLSSIWVLYRPSLKYRPESREQCKVQNMWHTDRASDIIYILLQNMWYYKYRTTVSQNVGSRSISYAKNNYADCLHCHQFYEVGNKFVGTNVCRTERNKAWGIPISRSWNTRHKSSKILGLL